MDCLCLNVNEFFIFDLLVTKWHLRSLKNALGSGQRISYKQLVNRFVGMRDRNRNVRNQAIHSNAYETV